ncbi:HTTM domain-containing protein [Sphingobacteriaceae bacterium]|nr:HTTM domain-containing protein [Sphingobacteriaceae bacterium]
METAIKRLLKYLSFPVNIAPLVIFRIAFGALMFISISRFIYKGWVYSMYIQPKLFFPYYGFEWVKPFSAMGMYLVFALLLLCSLGIILGALYRVCILTFFVLFTYVELIDKTNYLNHYYFVSIVSFLLIFCPASDNFSLDTKIFRKEEHFTIPRFYIFMLQLQMFLVYFFAGVAKLNADWLFDAKPLSIWLPAFSHFPVIGGFMEEKWLAYVFCWFGCTYDLLIGFLLFNRRTVNAAYLAVLIFHLATALFFNIGMFPYIMITITSIFFKEEFHIKLLHGLKKLTSYKTHLAEKFESNPLKKWIPAFFLLYFVFQFVMPFRYLLYPGKLFWTEQGYRFSWRVMLMEKAGSAFFYVKDTATGRQTIIDNKEYLTFMQEKMMATQPDMMVDYAKFLKKEYQAKGFTNASVYAQSYVTMNGSGSREFIDPTIDLSAQSNSIFVSKTWVKSY